MRLLPFVLLMMTACASYKQNIMFKNTDGYTAAPFKQKAGSVEQDNLIQKNDLLRLAVYSNNGERFIDPNPDLTNPGTTGGTTKTEQPVNYLVDQNGLVKLPLIGELKLEGLTLRKAEEITQKEYSKYFKEAYVQLTFANKRVIVLGAPGGQVIPLTNQNVTVAEVLAMAKGVGNDGKSHNIRLIRENKVFIIDFSTIKGFQEGNVVVQSGDIIYVEPVRRPIAEGFRDNTPLVSLLVSVLTLIYILRK